MQADMKFKLLHLNEDEFLNQYLSKDRFLVLNWIDLFTKLKLTIFFRCL